jgi:hypothetical protein
MHVSDETCIGSPRSFARSAVEAREPSSRARTGVTRLNESPDVRVGG